MLMAGILIYSSAQAAVVMTGTRVIISADQNEKTIHFQNKDNTPNIVQVWLDSGDDNSTPETGEAPLLANPQIFKIAPAQGQVVRMIFTGNKKDLPTDIESLFYLNFSEIPSSKSSDAEKNKLMVVFKNRVKVFYRPENLSTESHEIFKKISYKIIRKNQKNIVQISNDSPYFANIVAAHWAVDNQETVIATNTMIPPKSSVELDIDQKNLSSNNGKLHLSILNDYGVANKNQINNSDEKK